MRISSQLIASKKQSNSRQKCEPAPLAANSNKDLVKVRTLELSEQIGEYQNILHDQQKHKFMIVPRGLDMSGKAETVKIVFGRISPAGTRSIRFKAATVFE
jgi:polyphosphate kinase 2 (PPK2 family)